MLALITSWCPFQKSHGEACVQNRRSYLELFLYCQEKAENPLRWKCHRAGSQSGRNVELVCLEFSSKTSESQHAEPKQLKHWQWHQQQFELEQGCSATEPGALCRWHFPRPGAELAADPEERNTLPRGGHFYNLLLCLVGAPLLWDSSR